MRGITERVGMSWAQDQRVRGTRECVGSENVYNYRGCKIRRCIGIDYVKGVEYSSGQNPLRILRLSKVTEK